MEKKEVIVSSTNVSFTVSDKELKFEDYNPPKSTTVTKYIQDELERHTTGTKVLLSSTTDNAVYPDLKNGFVGAALRAYNKHYHFVLKPDDVWIMIVTSLTRFIDANAERLRNIFVEHSGKKELVVRGGGTILTADYDSLVKLMSDEIGKNTKGDINKWVECDFSTSDQVSKFVSRIVLMGAMKNYFTYKIELDCGLPRVTLEGTKEDWMKLLEKTKKMKSWEDPTLTNWQEILQDTLQHFVDAFDSKIDRDWWNRICHITGGGSGPAFLEGWILSLIAFNDEGRYILSDFNSIKKTNSYGQLNTNDVPKSSVEVPVTVDDNGTEYKVKLIAGSVVSICTENVIRPSLDWVLVDVTNEVQKKNKW